MVYGVWCMVYGILLEVMKRGRALLPLTPRTVGSPVWCRMCGLALIVEGSGCRVWGRALLPLTPRIVGSPGGLVQDWGFKVHGVWLEVDGGVECSYH